MNELLEGKLFDAFAKASQNTFIYVSDMKSDLTRWSTSAVDFFGLEDEYMVDTKNKWVDRIHPDDRQVYLDDISAVFSGESENHDCQYRVRNKFGEYSWVECKGAIIKDGKDNPVVFAGAMTRIDHQSKYDSLTHLLTGYELVRTPFDEAGTLILIGVDNFRNINSQYGIVYGNKVLLHLSEVLTNSFPDAKVYRFRGDEFAVCCKGNKKDVFIEAYKKISESCDNPGTEIAGYNISAGIVEYDGSSDATDILARAELTIAEAKSQKNKRCMVYSTELEKKHIRRNLILEALAKSIKNGCEGFRLVYQPVMSNDGKSVEACESLLRWEPDDKRIGKCFPDEFIPILESSGGIIEVGYFVMREAIKQAAKWQKLFGKLSVAFNVSYLQLEDPEFVPATIREIEEYKIDSQRVAIELTESVFAKDALMVRDSFEQLKSHGVRMALDDFGTGNSSFWTLQKIDFDVIKIDQSFIRNLDTSQKEIDLAIIESVCLMCKRMGYSTIAEGVENNDVWNILKDFNFKGLQGYHFSRPLEEDVFEKYVKEMNGIVE